MYKLSKCGKIRGREVNFGSFWLRDIQGIGNRDKEIGFRQINLVWFGDWMWQDRGGKIQGYLKIKNIENGSL